jgi:hypothetical protein
VNARSESAKDRTRAVRDTARGSKNQTIAGAMKELFREAAGILTRHESDELKPETRRGRGETDRGFHMAAKTTLQRAVRMPADAYSAATAFLADARDWLNLWHDDTASIDDPNSGCHHPYTNHLHPHA